MQLKPIIAIIVLLLVVASLSVAGCTVNTISPSPSPTQSPTVTTPTPAIDYSSVLNSKVESGNFIMTRPFTKSTNGGYDVYKGVGRNATRPGSTEVTLVFELTNTQAEGKQVYDKIVAAKLQEGYTLNPTVVAGAKAASPSWVDVWYGTYGSNWFECSYGYGPELPSWTVTQQSS